ncbi:aldo/keto reductase [Gilvimarinus algae]|uniref:Aldo/keto reductase n=1 Tax=Gilvimarinus algae TaxID=3058037 RepID=A0ABT8TGU4_9GAMM|nr:aldo/keto reductase [Gilvimarinus sp. SDUM040014]MDO3383315.1 aldo/keto reductase [Gilvimarinus sp. SDUM040014]
MRYSTLGHSGLKVSRVCLGTMTWGRQNDQQEANQQIEYALAHGINFIDTAEMYAVPPTADTYGTTETIIGHWLAANSSRRDEFILASKIAGNGLKHIRGGGDITGETVIQAIDDSLARLQTDYIDLYQLHWPNRTSPHFGKHAPGRIRFSDVNTAEHSTQMLEILQALDECVKAGKILHFGLSNDTPWGVNEYIRLSEKHNLTRVTSIQNEFNLLQTRDWPFLIENCVHQRVAYLPWSPLATGALTGKYLNGARPPGARWNLIQRNGLFRDTEHTNAAVADYLQVAQKHGLSPAQMALAWCDQVDGVTSTIIGATHMDQLKENIAAFELSLSDTVLADIAEVHRRYPVPF